MKLAVIASGEVIVEDVAEYIPSDVTELVIGKGDGIGSCVRNCAEARGLALTEFSPALFSMPDASGAVPAYHREMLAYADELLLFWDGRSRDAEETAFCAEDRNMNIRLIIVDSREAAPGAIL